MRRSGTRGEAQLGKKMFDVPLRGTHRYRQAGRYLSIGQPLGDQLGDLTLALGRTGLSSGRCV